MTVKGKYGLGTYLGFFVAFTFLAMFIVIASEIYSPENKTNSQEIPSIALMIPFLGIVVALYYTFKNGPHIIIDQQSISLKRFFGKKKTIKEEDIEEIDLFEMDSLTNWDTIVTRIKLLTGEKIKIADPCYRN